jgi:hypothetical protein
MSICQESSLLSIIRTSHSFVIILVLWFMYYAKIYKCPHPHPKKLKIILEGKENYRRHWIDTNRTGLRKSLTNGHDQERGGGGSLPFNMSFLIYSFDDVLWRRHVAFHSKIIFISFAYFQTGRRIAIYVCRYYTLYYMCTNVCMFLYSSSGDFGWSLARGSLKSSTGPTRDQGSSLDSGIAGRTHTDNFNTIEPSLYHWAELI